MSERTRFVYYTAASLDGFIADDDNSLDWLFEVPDDGGGDGPWEAFIARVGTLVMGATTYQWILDRHPEMLEGPEKWREFYDDRPAFVFTHQTLPLIPGIDIRLAQGQVVDAAEDIVAARPGEDVWIVGGGDLVGQFDDVGLLDEVQVHVTPVVLGSGAPLLPRRITSSRLRFRESALQGQRLNVVLDVRRPDGVAASPG